VPTTAYKYRGSLNYGASYFWQVTPVRPYPGQPSPVFSFTTVAIPNPVQPAEQMSNQLLQLLLAVFLLNILGNVTVITVMVLVHRRRGDSSGI